MIKNILNKLRRHKKLFQYFIKGGRYFFNDDLQCYIAKKKIVINNKTFNISGTFRSPREKRRWIDFAEQTQDFTFSWYTSMTKSSILWDIGSANGLEGFLAYQVSNCSVVFFEPFIPGAESILKTGFALHLNKKKESIFGVDAKLNLLQCGISSKSSFAFIDLHTFPTAGETKNSISTLKKDYCYGGREKDKYSISLLTPIFCLDDLVKKQKFIKPTHIKIDVDGLEVLVLKGAKKLLSSGSVKSIVVEVNGQNLKDVEKILFSYNNKKKNEHVHNTGIYYTADILFEL